MMTEIWWKAFLAAIITAIITVVVAKLFGCEWGIFLLFSISFIGWSFGLVLFVIVGERVYSVWKKRKEKRQR